MAHLDPKDAFEHLQSQTLAALKTHFPIKGKVQSLHLEGLEVKDAIAHDDLASQKDAKVKGKTWSVPVYGELVLRNNETGAVVDKKKMRLVDIPKTTQRYSYIVGGQEYQVDSQWQLKAGAYVRRRDNGELETRFNVTGRPAFDLMFEPDKKRFLMEYGKSKAIPVYSVMKAMGVTDDEMEKAWGKQIFQANKAQPRVATGVEQFYKASKGVAAPSAEEAHKHLLDSMAGSTMRPEAVDATLGKPFSTVTGEALRLATEKMLKVQSGHPEDDRDSLVFKDLRTTGDFAYDRLTNGALKRGVAMKAMRKLNTSSDIREILRTDGFQGAMHDLFHKNAAARVAAQVNPLEMLSSSQQTTIMGSGGIQSEQQITNEAKMVNASHLGFLDPVVSPEGSKTGVTLRLPLGAQKVGKEARTSLYNLKTGKLELVSPAEFLTKKVVFPDQVKWVDGKPVPRTDQVKMSVAGNELAVGSFKEADYAIRHPSQLFSMGSNTVPFLGSTSGNRATYAANQMGQAISLLHREQPLVQSGTGIDKHGAQTFEQIVGGHASQAAPAHGTVKSITKDHITIQGHDGKSHQVSLYNDYPLNDAKSHMNSTPLVKVGDSVKAGQVLADTNYTHKGTLALGANLEVAYIPYKGYNFEDGVVISQDAAKKLTSMHMHRPELALREQTVLDKHKFTLRHPMAYTKEQLSKIGDNGTIKVGQTVRAGDPLVLAMNPFEMKDRQGESAIRKSLSGAHSDSSIRWDSDFEGTVVDVHHLGDKVAVHVKTLEPAQVGDKVSGRHGNKGIISLILPTHEMPQKKDGTHIDVALNPSGVPGRMNIGQVLEVAAGKIAQKTGKPYIVNNFDPNKDYLAHVEGELKAHGLSDTEELFDPTTKQSLGHTMTGPMHVLKLVHQVEKKGSARAGMGLPDVPNTETYNNNLQPTSGGGVGGQSIGTLGMYALLANGARANIREMQTWKSEGPDPNPNQAKRWKSQHTEVWNAIQTNSPLPTPKMTFAFQKFGDILRASGVNMDKKGHEFILTPMTDKQIVSMSQGRALPKPTALLTNKTGIDGNPKPSPGGLFDEHLTGGHGGTSWTHIPLAEPMPNPLFEAPIRHLTGLKEKDYDDVVSGKKFISSSGALSDYAPGHLTGGAAIKHLLDKVDVKRDLEQTKKELLKAPAAKIDKLAKKAKYLRALDQMNLKPSEAYVLHNLPVLPPVMRPVSQMKDGSMQFADMNGLYAEFAQANEKLSSKDLNKVLREQDKHQLRGAVYDGLKAIMGVGVPYKDAKLKGLLHQIGGASPKQSYFQDVLINRRTDLSMRSTIVPEPSLSIDEVGLPKAHASTLFRPFIVEKLVTMGYARTPLQAQELLAKKPDDPGVHKALEKVMEERPVLLKRDPALHKYSVQGFMPKLVEGSAIKIHPLVTGGYNADFDGDTMSVFVPISKQAVAEAHKMKPSNNLFSDATGKLAYMPGLESSLGLYKLSQVGKETGKSFKNPGDVLMSMKDGHLRHDDVVELNGKKTTPGRILLSTGFPEPMQNNVLHNFDLNLDKKGAAVLLTELAKKHKDVFDKHINKLKDLGNGASFGVVQVPLPGSSGVKEVDPHKYVTIPMSGVGTHTLSLKDFQPDREVRNRVLSAADAHMASFVSGGKKTELEKENETVRVYTRATEEIKKQHEEKMKANPNNLYMMHRAGVKPDWTQYQQMALAPMLVKDSANRTIPHPIRRSLGEGLDVAEYWTTMHGARRGVVMKVQEVQEPGYMTKLMQNNTMHLMVTKPDCGTTSGILMDVNETGIHDRHLQQDLKIGHMHLPVGTLLTPDVVAQVKAHDKNAKLLVRSPIKCEDEKGVCQKCSGLDAGGKHYELGANTGVLASHAIGERAVQLTLKAFHTGGAVDVSGGGKALNAFGRFEQLMLLPKTMPNAATLSMANGTIDKVEHDATGTVVTVNGQPHHIPKDARGNLLSQSLPGFAAPDWQPPKVGMAVKAGQPLSDPLRTYVNPHDLYKATKSIEKVQNHMIGEIYGLYKEEGVRRQHVETLVKAMSNLTKVKDNGDSESYVPGEFVSTSALNKHNQELIKSGKQPVLHEPVLMGLKELPRAIQNDWMARLQHDNLRTTLREGAALGAHSNIHDTHPIPAAAFGAEFGLTEKDKHTPGLGHLHNVPGHHY